MLHFNDHGRSDGDSENHAQQKLSPEVTKGNSQYYEKRGSEAETQRHLHRTESEIQQSMMKMVSVSVERRFAILDPDEKDPC